MEKHVELSIEDIVANLSVEVLESGNGSVVFTTGEIGRPGLQFAGYYSYFAPERVQVIGDSEMHYLYELDYYDIYERMERFMAFKVPCIVCSRGNQPPKALLDCAKAYGIPVFLSNKVTDDIGHEITNYIGRLLAPKILVHGALMDVFGVGVLLEGASGVGKSETVLAMIKQGHRLVADDVVEITKVAPRRLSGCAPELTRHLMEIRGIGIIDVRYLFGVGAVIAEKSIDFIVRLEMWNDETNYERFGSEQQFKRILDVDVPMTLLPVSPGRNLADVVEVAARNFRLKLLGYDAASEFKTKLKFTGD